MRDHGIVHGIGVFGDVEILLNNAPRIREERPMRADTTAKFVGLHDVVGADRNQPAITNLHLAVKLDQSLSLPTILRAVAAAAQYDDHRILSLQLRELSALCGVVGKFVVGKGCAWDHLGSHVKSSLVCCAAFRREPSQINDDVALGLRAADQHIAVCRHIDWVRPVSDRPGYKARLASVADPCPAGPSRGHVARFSKLEQALERRAPQGTFKPVRANETSGPPPIGPPGRWGGRHGDAATPGVMGGWEPKISV